MDYELIYIHPTGFDCYSRRPMIPMGVAVLMHSCSCTKRGIFYYELKKKLIRRAKIVALFAYLKNKNCRIGLNVQPEQIYKNSDYFRILMSLWLKYKFDMIEYEWDIDIPQPAEKQETEFKKFLALSKGKTNVLLYFKNRIIEMAYSRKYLFSLLMAISTCYVLFKSLIIYFVCRLKEIFKGSG